MEKLTEALQQLADKIGVTIQYLWPKVVLLHWVETLAEVIVTVLVVVIAWPNAIAGLRAWMRWVGDETRKRHSDADDAKFVAPVARTIIFGLMALIATAILLIGISGAIATLISPEGSLVIRALGK